MSRPIATVITVCLPHSLTHLQRRKDSCDPKLLAALLPSQLTNRRLRIGHTRLTHSYLLNRQDQPECSHCHCALTVAHVLLECNHYNVVRQRYLTFLLCMNYSTRSTPKIFLDLLEILGSIVSCNLTFIHLIDFITSIVLKPIVII